jgi:hypothetical protein
LPPDAYRAAAIFSRCLTQWRWIAGFGGALRVGLDYTALQAVMQIMGETPSADLLDDIQTLEIEAMRRLNGRK